jgi:biotin synthase
MMSLIESPEYVQTSLAGAMCLGLEAGRFMAKTQCTCLNLLLMYDSGCRASCSYCGLARSRQVDQTRTFIRVKWPAYSLQEILARVKGENHPFKRVCVSMITHANAVKDTCTIISRVRESSDLPVSGLLAPTVMDGRKDLLRIKTAGADRVGIAIDAATEICLPFTVAAGWRPPSLGPFLADCGRGGGCLWSAYGWIHLIVGLGRAKQRWSTLYPRLSHGR